MYLSRLILNPRNRNVQRELANPYELHRTVMRGFPETSPAGERVLFRVDTDTRTGTPTLLIQSHHEPDWGALVGREGYLLAPPSLPPAVAENPAVKAFALNLAPGQMLAFRLRGNPTVKRQGKRHGLLKEEEQRAWFQRKAQQGGFRIINVFVIRENSTHTRITSRAPEQAGKHHGIFLAARFEGMLQVTDPDGLWRTVQQGIGSGKSFGFGLLSLAPAR